MFQSIYTGIIVNTHKYLGKGSGWIINSIIDHTISISKYDLSSGNNYIKLKISNLCNKKIQRC